LSLDLYRTDPTHLDIDKTTKDIMNSYTPFPFIEGTHMARRSGT